MKNLIRLTLAAAAAASFGLVAAAPASAQATRTWISGVGDDVNPCSRTAPCKTFAGAISKTAAGGEINCLDPGGFGAVTITKSLTLSCPYTEGGMLAAGNGITINAAATDVVYLRGLDIFGVSPATHGVRFIAGGALHIEDSVIRRFNSTNSFGISFQPGGTAELYVNNVTIAENGNGTTGGGILIQPTGAAGTARVVITNSRINNNANNGIRVDTTNNTTTAGHSVVVENSEMNGNGAAGVSVNTPSATSTVVMMINESNLSNNATAGITTNGGLVTARMMDSTITGNGVIGVERLGGSIIFSFGGNRLEANPTVGAANNGTFTGAIIPTK